jgi:hypothetical protein
MKRLFLLFVVCMISVLALAQTDSSISSTDQGLAQPLVTNGCVSLTPNSRDFGNQPVDFPSASKPFLLLNGCMVNLHITNITAQGSAFTQTNYIYGTKTPCNTGAPLPPNGICEIDVVFDPPSSGSFGNNLVVTYLKDGNPNSMQISAGLTGTGIHDLTFSPTSCDFGDVLIGQEAFCTVTLQNQEPQRLTIDSCQVSPAPPFSQDTACPVSLAKKGSMGDSVDIRLDFRPDEVGVFSGTFAVTTDSPEEKQSGKPYTLPLTGVGCILIKGQEYCD